MLIFRQKLLKGISNYPTTQNTANVTPVLKKVSNQSFEDKYKNVTKVLNVSNIFK